jgi:hypothetical protein
VGRHPDDSLDSADIDITMTVQWFVTGASLLAALTAWLQARRAARRLDQLSKMYWELKYQHGELRTQIDRLAGTAASGRASSAAAATTAFVPLASLKR